MTKSIRNPALAFLAILSISFVLVCFAFSTPATATCATAACVVYSEGAMTPPQKTSLVSH